MTVKQLELRVADLERQMAELTQSLTKSPARTKSGWRAMVGAFAGDKDFEKIVEEGRKLREAESKQAKKTARGTRSNVRS